MAVRIIHLPAECLLVTRYSDAHSAQDAEAVVMALETNRQYATCDKFLIDLAAVSTIETSAAKRPDRLDRMLAAVRQGRDPTHDNLILIAYFAPAPPGDGLARSYQPQWNTRAGIVSMASRSLSDCATFLNVTLTDLVAAGG